MKNLNFFKLIKYIHFYGIRYPTRDQFPGQFTHKNLFLFGQIMKKFFEIFKLEPWQTEKLL